MAGSFSHVVQKDGNLAGKTRILASLEDGDAIFETIEEMYGMIWFLAATYGYQDPKKAVQDARNQYREGLKMAKEVNG